MSAIPPMSACVFTLLCSLTVVSVHSSPPINDRNGNECIHLGHKVKIKNQVNVWIALLDHMMIVPSKDYVTNWSHYTENSIMHPQKM